MIKKISAVIGVNYGDEGKGQVVSNLIEENKPVKHLVVRYNGGAQAGHTVNYNGKRHVFSHFGSGTLQGVATYLTKEFVVNVGVFYVEYQELDNYFTQISDNMARLIPIVFAHDNVKMTFPLDVMWNRYIEDNREDKHGSVGLGINATIQRYKDNVGVINRYASYNQIDDAWTKTIEYYYKKDIGFTKYLAQYNLDVVLETFKKQFDFYQRKTYNVKSMYQDLSCSDYHVIFEGAQGLQLSEQYGVMPYCTPTHCGVSSIFPVLDEFKGYGGINDDLVNMNAIYVTRPYVTRHGNGPLENEVTFDEISKHFDIVDETNVPNQYQGSIRYAYLNPEVIRLIVDAEPNTCYEYGKPTPLYVNKVIYITCCDQIKDRDKKIPIKNSMSWSNRYDRAMSNMNGMIELSEVYKKYFTK